eukprot:7261816-Pyramimonas_sp.AAC.1
MQGMVGKNVRGAQATATLGKIGENHPRNCWPLLNRMCAALACEPQLGINTPSVLVTVEV